MENFKRRYRFSRYFLSIFEEYLNLYKNSEIEKIFFQERCKMLGCL